MKKILLVFLLLSGCTMKNHLQLLEEKLYEQEEVYVQIEDIHEKLLIQEKDYEDYIALKTLVIWNQKEIMVFKNPSNELKDKLISYKKENHGIYEINSYLIYVNDDQEMIDFIYQSLNEKE